MASSFTKRVYELAAKIPAGKVLTYGQLAALAGSPGAARAVGACMKNNPDRDTIPCHRVVASDGALTGYAFGEGILTKKQLLIKEGVVFRGERVDISTSRWNTTNVVLGIFSA